MNSPLFPSSVDAFRRSPGNANRMSIDNSRAGVPTLRISVEPKWTFFDTFKSSPDDSYVLLYQAHP